MAVTAPPTTRETRSATGNSKPRVIQAIEAPLPTGRKAGVGGTKKKVGAKPKAKANTSKPRVNKTTTGKVEKKKAPAKKAKAAVNGTVKKVEKATKKTEAKAKA